MKLSGVQQFLILLVLVVLVALWQVVTAILEYQPITNFPPKGTHIIAFGDDPTGSIATSTYPNGYIWLLDQRLHVAIINKGVHDETSTEALRRLDPDVLASNPDIVIILPPQTAAAHELSTERTLADLRTMILRIQSGGAVVLLAGTEERPSSMPLADGLRKLAHETGSAFIPNALPSASTRPIMLSAEGTHADDLLALKIADKIAPILEGIVFSAPSPIPTATTSAVAAP